MSTNIVMKEIQKSLQTLSEMMQDRGYSDVSKQLEKLIEKDIVFHVFAHHTMHYFDFKHDSNPRFIRLLFIIQPKWKMNDIRKILDDGFDQVILVVRDKMSTNNVKMIKEADSVKGLDIQVFHLRELQYNVTHHVLVPKHILMSFDQERAINDILQAHFVKSRYHFPLILKTDPVARYFNAKTGQLFKIIRSSPSAGEYIFYRCVV